MAEIDVRLLLSKISPHEPRQAHEMLASALHEYKMRLERERQARPGGLMNFIEYFWDTIEPGRQFIDGWPLRAMAMHLEAVTYGAITRLLINVPPGSMKPVYIEEPVMTRRGFVRLGDIVVGDEVLTHAGRFRRVTAVHEQGILPLIEIQTVSGRNVRTAPDHPFLTTRGWVQASQITDHDYVGIPHVAEEFGDNSMSPEEARLLGYLVGDGCISQDSMNLTSADDESIEDFIYCAEKLGFYAYAIKHPNPNVKAKKVPLLSSEKRWIKKGEPPVRAWIKSHGLYRSNSYSKFIPDGVFRSGPTAIANFIGAYWSCDGMIKVRHQNTRTSMIASATTVSKRLASDIQRALMCLNIHSRVRLKSVKLNSKSQPGGVYYSYDIISQERNEVAKFANLPGLLTRKRNEAKKAFFDIFPKSIYEDEVADIVNIGSGQCRCLTVDEDHTFTVNGLIVHNSLMTNVFWPAWQWSAAGKPGMRFINFSYSAFLTERDNQRMSDLIDSQKFQDLWGHMFTMRQKGVTKISNSKFGWKFASSVRGTGTGERADVVILDDPHNIKEGESQTIREETVRWFREAMSNRLNDMTKSAIICIMQRVHQDDVSGTIIEEDLGYDHLMIPMLFEPGRTAPTSIGWEDPRIEDGECFWPERFPPAAVEECLKLGEFAFASQYQQRPAPRGGGIFKNEYWNVWEPEDGRYPNFDFILGSVDPAYTHHDENDPSAMTIWGVNYADDGTPRVFLIAAWRKWLQLHGPAVVREYGESEYLFLERQKKEWGLVEWIGHTCKRFQVDHLLIESKASGISVMQEMQRLLFQQKFGIEFIDPGRADKEVRANRVQHIFSAGMIYRPDRPWATMVEDEMAAFPKARYDDLTDTATYALWWLRQHNMLTRREELKAANDPSTGGSSGGYRESVPLYPM